MSLRSYRLGKRHALVGLTVALGALACSSKPSGPQEEPVQATAEALATASCQALDVAVKKDATAFGATTYAIKTNGEVWGWGANQAPFFALGHSSVDPNLPLGAQATSPVSLGVSGATQLAAGHDGACALLADHTVKCWGRYLGDVQGSVSDGRERPRTINILGDDGTTEEPLTDVRTITYGDFHACAIRNDTSVWCWGDDRFGQLGTDDEPTDGSVSNAMTVTAVRMANMVAVSQIAAAGSTTCLLRTLPSGLGEVDCLGDGSLGKLGTGAEDGSPTSHPIPNSVTAPAGTNFVALYGGGHGTFCATARAGTAQTTYCWGANAHGAAVIANTNHATSPTQVSTNAGALWAQGDQDGCEINSTGALSCWGANASGQVPGAPGGGADVLANTPIAVSNAFRVSLGETHGCALTGSSLSCWGSDASGEIGNGTTATTAPITKVYLSVPPTACGTGQVGQNCGVIADACGSTDCGACGPLNSCNATTHTCQDNPTACPQGCAAGTFCSQHACVTACGTQAVDANINLTSSGAIVTSPATYGANACGAYLIDVANASQFQSEQLIVGPATRIQDAATCVSTRVTLTYFKNNLELPGTAVTAFGQWNTASSGGLQYCGYSGLGSDGVWTNMPAVSSGDLRLAAKVEQSSSSGKSGVTWSIIPLKATFFHQTTGGGGSGSSSGGGGGGGCAAVARGLATKCP